MRKSQRGNPNQLKMFMSGEDALQINSGVDFHSYDEHSEQYSRMHFNDLMSRKYEEGEARTADRVEFDDYDDDYPESLNESLDRTGIHQPIVLYPHVRGESPLPFASGRGAWDNQEWQFGNGHHRAAWLRKQGRQGRERYAPVIYDDKDYMGSGQWGSD